MYDDGPEHEPFGPEYVRPQNAGCPDCSCCTAALCAVGRASVSECVGHVDDAETIARVTGCPCSAEFTRGTIAWRAGMIRAVTFATEKPLRSPVESLLTRLSEDQPYADVAQLLPKLTARRYVRWKPGMEPVVTDFGWAYISARWGARRTTSLVTIKAVDVEAATVQVLASSFSVDELVTVPLHQVVNSRTGLTVETAVGATLYAELNADAPAADLVVLTKVSNPAMAVTARPDSPDGAR
ncbi:hypothetical protein DI272_19240 [Streptomyces sp. Act143]|nr:hypothetical protein DI272_19240 [Streptomyces sp. Act143]